MKLGIKVNTTNLHLAPSQGNIRGSDSGQADISAYTTIVKITTYKLSCKRFDEIAEVFESERCQFANKMISGFQARAIERSLQIEGNDDKKVGSVGDDNEEGGDGDDNNEDGGDDDEYGNKGCDGDNDKGAVDDANSDGE
ncbi:hypothetical protein PoB_003098300 [Plakobranchus ocellatus]|uniref:Uncharacterized protein n=1 Tax=Plakobranchus ocellatus TaxID=259542 RepID=A0AAV4AB66_9GAST|nr:hypothetical protein PoB_003098300 [Plakobranchus ocellatus]